MDYSKYGISESYMPTVYHNRIVIDKTTAATVNKNLTESAYIQGDTGFLGNESDSTIQTLVTVNMNIVFNVSSYADFVSLTKDDDFASSFKVESYLCWKNPNRNINAVFVNGSPNFGKPALAAFPQKYASQLTNLASNINNVDKKIFSLVDVFKNISNDSLNLTNFDNFTRYQRQFPDGRTYFQVPYTIKFEVPFENIPQMYFLSVTSVKDFDIDLNLNFGGFEIDDDNITSVSALEAYNLGSDKINYGPLMVDTLIDDNNTQTKGVLYTIAQNQSTYQGQIPEGVNLQEVTGSDILREEKFNDLKGTPWLGGVHKHEGRYMAGASHTNEIHPYLDANVVLNKKLIDLRPIKEIKEQKINLTPLLKNVKSTKINYFADNSKNNLLEKLTVISEPLLSIKKEDTSGHEHVDGFFAINYTNFLRKHSIFSSLVENENIIDKLKEQQVSFAGGTTTINYLSLVNALQNTLKIKISRYEIKSKISTLIYDSSKAESNGTFISRPSLSSKQYSGNLNNIEIPLGFLNVVNMNKGNLGINDKYSILEFYNFTDMDRNKALDTEYKYEIEIEMIDPVYYYLSNGIKIMDEAIRGNGKTLGLQQILTMIKIKTGKMNPVSGGKDFPYVVDNSANQESINSINNSTIIDAIRDYDNINNTTTLTEGNNPKLLILEKLFNSSILSVLGSNSSGLASVIGGLYYNITNLEDAGNISIDLFQLAINTLSSIRDNLKDAINAISNVDIGTQSFGYRAATKSAQNGNLGKRIIKEKIRSMTKISTDGYGFDYLRLFPTSDNNGLKQLPSAALKQVIDTVYLPKFFNVETLTNSANPKTSDYLDNYKYSTLPLTKKGVVLPKGLYTEEDYKNWSNLLQFLLLYLEKNASRLTKNTTFTYTENDASDFRFDINRNILGLSIVNDNNIGLFKSLDRGQKQLATKGLSIQDEIKTNQSIFVEYSDEAQTDQNNPDSAILIDNLKRNNISDYFLNYVNNAVEGGNENKNNTLAFAPDVDPNFGITLDAIPVLSLLEYLKGTDDTLGNPEPGVSYRDYYENRVWSPNTYKLFLDKFAEFYFDFINSVRVEYMSGFENFDYNGILEDSSQSNTDQLNNVNISSYKWLRLTNSAINNLQDGQVMLCKLVDFVPSFFAKANLPLTQKLKTYKKYYNYFLIIKGQKDLEIRVFGSTI